MRIIGNKRKMEHYKNRYWLKQKYLVDGFASDEIGDLCGVTGRTVRYHLKKFGIKSGRNSDIKARRVHIKLPYYLHENLKKHCGHKKTTVSSITRMALIEFMVKNNLNPYKER